MFTAVYQFWFNENDMMMMMMTMMMMINGSLNHVSSTRRCITSNQSINIRLMTSMWNDWSFCRKKLQWLHFKLVSCFT